MSQENTKDTKDVKITPKSAKSEQLSEQLQVAAAASGAAVNQKPKIKAEDLPKSARVRSVGGDMRHLLTNQLVTAHTDVKMEIDAFAAAQIVAGKWEIVKD